MFQKSIFLIAAIFLSNLTHAQKQIEKWENDVQSLYQESFTGYKPNYIFLKNNEERLGSLVSRIDSLPMKEGFERDQIAFWLNVHNLVLLHEIVKQYPIERIEYQDALFDRRVIIRGEYLSLKKIHDEKLLPFVNKDPRLIFLIWDGRVSGFNMVPKVYRAESINATLISRTDQHLSDVKFVEFRAVENSLTVNRKFREYLPSFKATYGGIIPFLNQTKKWSIPNLELGMFPFDYSLNQIKPTKVDKYKLALTLNKGPRTYRFFHGGILLPFGRWDLNLFSNLYTQTKFTGDGQTFDIPRQSYFTQSLSIVYGFSQDASANLGVELQFKSTMHHSTVNAATTDIFGFSNSDTSQTKLSRINVFYRRKLDKKPAFSYQLGIRAPLAKNLSTNPFLEFQHVEAYSQLFWSRMYGEKTQLFLQSDLHYGLELNKLIGPKLGLSQTAVYTYLFGPDFFAYALGQLAVNRFIVGGSSPVYLQTGLGLKYLLLDYFQVEILATDFVLGSNTGLGETYNLGIRYMF